MSSSKRWDLCIAHKDKGGKWRSTKVGVVFAGDKGQLNIKIDPGISISTPEGVTLTGWEPRERDDSGPRQGGGRQQQDDGGGGGYGGDDIPFNRVGDVG